ncbi:hypothetical protein ACHAXM_010785, partial [Skeletonema potamos]
QTDWQSINHKLLLNLNGIGDNLFNTADGQLVDQLAVEEAGKVGGKVNFFSGPE